MATKKRTKKTRAKSTAKPAVTSNSINQLIRPLLGQARPDARAAKLSRDWRAFIKGELSFTETQSDNLSNIPAGEADKVQRAFKHVVTHGGEFSVRLGSKDSSGTLVIKITGTGAKARRFTIPILTCKYDANCRNWKCHWGPDIPVT